MGNGRRIAIRVPASTANLGSGFDVLGLALGLYNTIEMETTSRGVEVTVEGEGAGRLQGEGKRSLVVRAAEAAFAHLGVTPPGPQGPSQERDPVEARARLEWNRVSGGYYRCG